MPKAIVMMLLHSVFNCKKNKFYNFRQMKNDFIWNIVIIHKYANHIDAQENELTKLPADFILIA